jgi:UDP-N-acetylglucosamine 2-epimerase (non-hydrolysing)
MNMVRPLLVFGTRPEAIKMAPIVGECRRRRHELEPIVCLTGQHREMLRQVTDWFGIREDENLDLMTPNQSLAGLTARCIEGIDGLLRKRQPDCVVAQGDTVTVMAASLAAFYRKVPFVHVEAGLRSGNLYAPWPEELSRRVADMATALCCAPTRRAADNLLAEGVAADRIRVTGNTVIDALLETIARQQDTVAESHAWSSNLDGQRLILITGHRRENFGCGLQNICTAIATLADRFRDCCFLYPVHLNPNVQHCVHRALSGRRNVLLTGPVGYAEFVWLMHRSTLILTDSGGIQEEAPSLGKPVLVMRETTERPEAVEAGACRLVGTSVEGIVRAATTLLTDPIEYAACQVAESPYGDGRAARRIVDWIVEEFGGAAMCSQAAAAAVAAASRA